MPVTTQSSRANCGGARGAPAPSNQNKTAAGKKEWQKGDIAFLKTKDRLSVAQADALLKPAKGEKYGYMNERALGHPVIILDRISPQSDHVMITSVSAYSVEMNGGLPPWKQRCHRTKNPQSFRSFDGCERYNKNVPPLYLVDGQQMPKPAASWVYCDNMYVVPLTVLGVFTKSKWKADLRMQPDSLKELMSFMSRRPATSAKLAAAQRRLHMKEPQPVSAGSPSNSSSPSPRVLPPNQGSTNTASVAATTTTAAAKTITTAAATTPPGRSATPAAAPVKRSWASIA
ncbi:hypothetical protein QBC34DRAFT_465975, partial [Podospora aff. communis PSN243]